MGLGWGRIESDLYLRRGRIENDLYEMGQNRE